MARRKGKITCRKCGMVFNGAEEWASFEDCTNVDCRCPKVKEAVEVTNNVINKARQVPTKTIIIKKEHDIPRRYGQIAANKVDSMVYIEVPTIQTFQVTPIRGKFK